MCEKRSKAILLRTLHYSTSVGVSSDPQKGLIILNKFRSVRAIRDRLRALFAEQVSLLAKALADGAVPGEVAILAGAVGGDFGSAHGAGKAGTIVNAMGKMFGGGIMGDIVRGLGGGHRGHADDGLGELIYLRGEGAADAQRRGETHGVEDFAFHDVSDSCDDFLIQQPPRRCGRDSGGGGREVVVEGGGGEGIGAEDFYFGVVADGVGVDDVEDGMAGEDGDDGGGRGCGAGRRRSWIERADVESD